ncbi:glycosyltransferase family 2 protein [Rheinheimera sp. MM224]|uniref:glycosyltransferase family 2 protein n=1 Tax=Rheinheimera sp. MM224 TaxID=3019969 RepID=UPI0021F8F5E8|nr:glycosyltransferase family 2 protein [Rheinheimera sp. MM224]CAI3796517.1 Putative teichuronic acid biosynthesis glycosyltransferase TuaG [Rheinheimera sp. MM224]
MAQSVYVSVIMPAYNVAGYIAESIQSVIAQSFQQWELLIVDDRSTDDTVNVVQQYANDSRIKLIQNDKNLGGAGSRNVAIKAAQGRYIAFLDSDDLWAPEKLERQLAFMHEKKADFSFSGYSTITEQGAVVDDIEVPSKINFNKLLKHNYIGCLTAIYDTKPFGKIYMPLVRKRQDFALWLELLKRFDYAYGLNENLGQYRVRAGSLSASKKDALVYYWRVLRQVGECNLFSSIYNISCYLVIVFLKKKYVKLYNQIFIS